MSEPRSVEQVIADNIQRIRTASDPRVSQSRLADRMGAIDGGSRNRSRVSDLETGRTGTPHPASWRDIVTVALALDVPVADVVLPIEGESMILAEPSVDVEIGEGLSLSQPVVVDRTGASEFFQGEYGSIHDEIKQLRMQMHRDRKEWLEVFASIKVERSPGPTVTVLVPPITEKESH